MARSCGQRLGGRNTRRGGCHGADLAADGVDQSGHVRLVKAAQHAFPTVGKAAGWVVLAVLEQVVETAPAFAVVALDVKELVAEGVQVCLGEFAGVGCQRFPLVYRAGVVSGKGFQWELVLGKRSAVIAEENFRWEPVRTFADDLVAIIEGRPRAVKGAP